MPMDEWELRLWIQRALDVIAASINEPMSPNFAGTVFAQHAAEPDGVKNLFVGMLNVALVLLLDLERATEKEKLAILREIANRLESPKSPPEASQNDF